ncbi:MAG: hypothetical protein SGJ02_11355 [bacterium]|nr:hypothetical protein [bacterium]
MRVHPGFFAPKSRKWQFPAAFALLIFLLAMNVFRGPKEFVVAKEISAPQKLQDVLIVKSAFAAGEPLDKSKIVIEKRAVNSLPVDAVSTFNDIEGMVAAGPIPAGYPLAKVLIAKPVPMIPISAEADRLNKELDPIDVMLQEIMHDTVALPVMFSGAAPKKGERIALALHNMKGDTVLILDSAWVSDSGGSEATIRVPPDRAVYIQSAIRYGSLSHIGISTEGSSPYTGHTVDNLSDLQVSLGLATSSKSTQGSKVGPRTFRSYVWVKGTSERFGLDDNGALYLVDENGRELSGPVISSLK